MDASPQKMNQKPKAESSSILFPIHPKIAEQNDIFLTKQDENDERLHIQKVQNAFQYYRKYANMRLNKALNCLNSLSLDDQRLLSKYRTHLETVRKCIDSNQAVIKEILGDNVPIPSGGTNEDVQSEEPPSYVCLCDIEQNNFVDDADVVEPLKILKAQSTLKLIARDWSADGTLEREQSYKPIIDAILEYYRPVDYAINEIKILVPGAGLGRLTYELACHGYACEGNEFSYFMLIASNFVLNLCDKENKYVLYPWVHQYVNNLRRADQVAEVRFPDVCPVKNVPKGNIEMAAGDFLEVYKTPNSYNCVATCFFIDCANNVIDFIRTIYKILVPGGIWVNLGPLLYHYSDVAGENSIEPTYEDLVIIMETIGFDILNSRTGIRTKYAQNPRSLKQSEYESIFWVCKKPPIFKNNNNGASSHVPPDLIMNSDNEIQQDDVDFETETERAELEAIRQEIEQTTAEQIS